MRRRTTDRVGGRAPSANGSACRSLSGGRARLPRRDHRPLHGLRAAVECARAARQARWVAEFDATRATARDVLLIALAGPAASLAGAVTTGWALSAGSPSGVLRGLLWAATLGGVFATVLNLIPFRFREGRDEPTLRTDGRVALDALRIARAVRSPLLLLLRELVRDDRGGRAGALDRRHVGRRARAAAYDTMSFLPWNRRARRPSLLPDDPGAQLASGRGVQPRVAR